MQMFLLQLKVLMIRLPNLKYLFFKKRNLTKTMKGFSNVIK